MKKLLNYTFIVALMLGIVACSSSNSPEGVVKNFYAALAKKDIDGAVKLIDFEGLKDAEMDKAKDKIKFMFGMMVDEAKEKGIDLANVKIGKVEYSADKKTASVEITMTGKDDKKETTTMPVVNREGTWKILLK